MASPDAVHNRWPIRAGEFGATYLGERDLIKLAFNDSGVIYQQATCRSSAAARPERDPHRLRVCPRQLAAWQCDTLPADVIDPKTTFQVTRRGQAAHRNAEAGRLLCFSGTAGQVIAFQVISNTNTLNPIAFLPELIVVGPMARSSPTNVHEFESADSSLFDVVCRTVFTTSASTPCSA